MLMVAWVQDTPHEPGLAKQIFRKYMASAITCSLTHEPLEDRAKDAESSFTPIYLSQHWLGENSKQKFVK